MNKSDPIFYVHRAHSDSIMTTFFHFRLPPPPRFTEALEQKCTSICDACY